MTREMMEQAQNAPEVLRFMLFRQVNSNSPTELVAGYKKYVDATDSADRTLLRARSVGAYPTLYIVDSQYPMRILREFRL